MLTSKHTQLTRQKTLHLLDRLEIQGETAKSLYLTPGLFTQDIETFIMSSIKDIPPELINLVSQSKTGAVLFWSEQSKYLLLPPFPFQESRILSEYDISPLRLLLQQEFTIALVLVRLGAYAVGVFQGEKLISSKVGTGLVHSRQKKGGTSQRRFQRHREKQMEHLFNRVCWHAREHLEPYSRQLHYVVYSGERNTLLSFRKQCPFLQTFDNRTLDRFLNIRQPRQQTLKQAISEVWSSTVIHWYKEEN